MILLYGQVKGGTLVFNNQRESIEALFTLEGKKVCIRVEKETGVRTGTQNNALHKGFELLADALNSAGLDMRKVLKQEVNIDWTKDSIKEYLFKPIMELATGKESTTDLAKVGEIEKVWDTMFRFLGEKHGVEYIPFPNDNSKNVSAVSVIDYPVNDLKPLF
jgi:hypothetical protein